MPRYMSGPPIAGQVCADLRRNYCICANHTRVQLEGGSSAETTVAHKGQTDAKSQHRSITPLCDVYCTLRIFQI